MRLSRVVGVDDARAGRIVGALVVAAFLQGVGASAVLPLLPLYLRAHGTSTAALGAVMSAYFVAGVLTLYVAGQLADRFGHRAVILLGLVTYSAASVGFMAPVGVAGYVTLRALQGAGAGAVQVAGLALVGVVVPLQQRGRAFSAVYAAQLGGMAIGPVAGSVAGVGHLRWLFLATAVATLAAALPIIGRTPAHAGAQEVDIRRHPLHVTRGLIGVALVGVVVGLVTGVYETCWSLLMRSRGAAAWQIGFSWTLFALPFAAFSPVAGRLVDRLNRQRLAIGALVATCGFAATYPFLPHAWLLMVLGTAEAIGVAFAFPAAQSLLSQTAPAEALGRAQGLFTTAETASIAVAAAISGAMFGVARWIPFVTAAATGLVLTAALPWLWRGLPTHADTGAGRPVTPGPAEVTAAGALPGAAPSEV